MSSVPALHPDKRRNLRLAVDASYRKKRAQKQGKRQQVPLPQGDSMSLVDRMAFNLHEPGFRRYFQPDKSRG